MRVGRNGNRLLRCRVAEWTNFLSITSIANTNIPLKKHGEEVLYVEMISLCRILSYTHNDLHLNLCFKYPTCYDLASNYTASLFILVQTDKVSEDDTCCGGVVPSGWQSAVPPQGDNTTSQTKQCGLMVNIVTASTILSTLMCTGYNTEQHPRPRIANATQQCTVDAGGHHRPRSDEWMRALIGGLSRGLASATRDNNAAPPRTDVTPGPLHDVSAALKGPQAQGSLFPHVY